MRGASAPPMDPPLLLLFFSPLLSRLPCTHIHLHHNCGSLQSRASISADARIYRGPVVASKVPGCVSGAAAQTHPLAPWRERTHLCAPITAIYLRYPDLTNEQIVYFFWFLIEFWILNTGVCVQTTESQLFSPLSCAWSLEWCVDVCAQNCMHCRYQSGRESGCGAGHFHAAGKK